jgi:hypothetical protein
MANVTLRDVPVRVHEALRASAKKHYRSLNGELLHILAYYAHRERGWQEFERKRPEWERLQREIARKYPNGPDSVELIREDRDSR